MMRSSAGASSLQIFRDTGGAIQLIQHNSWVIRKDEVESDEMIKIVPGQD
jgi:hypothetical protein